MSELTKKLNDVGVLVVDDSYDMRKTMQSMLAEIGINQIFLAKDGMEALLFMGDCEDMVDLVLADWNMPVMSGGELLRQVRSADPYMPYILVTGRSDRASVIEAKAAGVTGYIAKPFSIDQLEEKLISALRISNNARMADEIESVVVRGNG